MSSDQQQPQLFNKHYRAYINYLKSTNDPTNNPNIYRLRNIPFTVPLASDYNQYNPYFLSKFMTDKNWDRLIPIMCNEIKENENRTIQLIYKCDKIEKKISKLKNFMLNSDQKNQDDPNVNDTIHGEQTKGNKSVDADIIDIK